jgi:hypothetical protein
VTKDDIIRMANESQISGLEICGDHDYDVVCTLDELELFANMVAAAEREACAKVCASFDLAPSKPTSYTIRKQVEAIRARGHG